MTNYSIQQLLHSKTFVRFLLSFLAIVLVVMIPFTIIQRQDLIKNRERELTLSSNNSLDLTVNYVDSLLFVTDNILNSVSMNSTLSTYRIQPDDMNRLASIRALSQFRNLNQLIVNLFYIPARDNGYYLS
ncbi:MAG: hypothetical protein IKR78_05355, partial [Dehalococcoidales bacterium]|nr:hypothetical protein [Dehalococcoidales bacterium]